MSLILIPFVFTLLLVLLITPLVIPLAKKFNLVDNPQKRIHPAHTHQGIIPRAGGLAIFSGFFISGLLFLPLSKILIGIFLGATILVILGILDDKYDLSPYPRFVVNILAAAIVVSAGVGIPYLTNPLGGVIRLDTWRLGFDFFGRHSILVWADLFAIFWIVWCTNLVNWSKGVDGQMPGFVGISAIVLGLLSLRFSGHDISQTTVTILAFITAAGFLGFLPWNFYPQKIMPGYSGGALAGFLLAVLSILSFGKLGTAVLVLAVPLIDAGYTILRRLVLFKSPFKGDAGHLHHKLLSLGWGRRRIALFYWLISGFLGIIALNSNSQQKFINLLALIIIIGAILLYLNLSKKSILPHKEK